MPQGLGLEENLHSTVQILAEKSPRRAAIQYLVQVPPVHKERVGVADFKGEL